MPQMGKGRQESTNNRQLKYLDYLHLIKKMWILQ